MTIGSALLDAVARYVVLSERRNRKNATIAIRRIRPPHVSHEVAPRSRRPPAPWSQGRFRLRCPASSLARRSSGRGGSRAAAAAAAAGSAAAGAPGAAARRRRGGCRDRRRRTSFSVRTWGGPLRDEGRGELVAFAQVREQDGLAPPVDADSPLVDLAARTSRRRPCCGPMTVPAPSCFMTSPCLHLRHVHRLDGGGGRDGRLPLHPRLEILDAAPACRPRRSGSRRARCTRGCRPRASRPGRCRPPRRSRTPVTCVVVDMGPGGARHQGQRCGDEREDRATSRTWLEACCSPLIVSFVPTDS